MRQTTACILIIALLAYSCAEKKRTYPPGTSIIEVIVDSSNSFWIDRVILESEKKQINMQGGLIPGSFEPCRFVDSAENGEITITIQSSFHRKLTIPVILLSDTVIHIAASQLPGFESGDEEQLALSDMTDKDTICVKYSMQGCYFSKESKTVITKHGLNYYVQHAEDSKLNSRSPGYYTMYKVYDTSFKQILRNLEMSCLEVFHKKQQAKMEYEKALKRAKKGSLLPSMNIVWSTTSEGVSMCKGNKVYSFSSYEQMPYVKQFIYVVESSRLPEPYAIRK